MVDSGKAVIMDVCLYSCMGCPAWKSHLLCAIFCCHLWPLWLNCIFPHIS